MVASQAQKLFRTIHAHLRNGDTTTNGNAKGNKSSYHKRMQALQDLLKNQQVYEASCFFLVATNNDSGNVSRRPTAADDSNDKPLDLTTFLNATTHSFSKTTFEMVLAYVKELQEEIVEAQISSNATIKYIPSAATARMKGAVKRKRDENRKERASAQEKKKLKSASSKKIHQSTTDMVLQIASQQDTEEEKETRRDRYKTTSREALPKERYPLSAPFLELKRKIVQASVLKAKESLKESEESTDVEA
ncbi:MAG: hypothetical protein SGARI_006954, partial [Bacillariaceae sp.]